MRELHVVALSEDGRHVVLATRAGAASGEFRVALDERLTAAVRGELPAPGRDAPPSISPREIQARLRDGASPEQIAAAAGVPLSRVERYAGPVLAEVERMVSGARAAVVSRPRLGPSAVPLGEAVEARLSEVAHLAEGSVRWTARRTDLGQWVAEVSWTARGRRRTAGWLYDPVAREVTAVDGPSAVLGHLEAQPPAAAAAKRGARPAASSGSGTRGRAQATSTRTAEADAPVRAPRPTGRPARRSGAAQEAAPAPAAVRRVRPGAAVPPAAAPGERTPARRAPARPSPDAPPAAARAQPRRPALGRRPVPSLDDAAAQERPASGRGPAAAKASATRPGPPVLRVVPPADAEAPVPADAAEPSPQTRPARRAAGGRDWADVLMGGAPAPSAAEPPGE